MAEVITNNLDLWSSALLTRSTAGRGNNSKLEAYGVKKLRELILELAVRGKLVPQDANDEPASILLKRIQAEKNGLIAEGKIKKEKPLAPITVDEQPFELPQGWEWARVAQVGHDWGQKTPDSDFTYIEVSAIDSQRGIVSSPELVKPENAPSRARKVVKKGSVIYSTIRPYLLNVAVIEDNFSPEPIASTAFAIVHPFCLMPPRYFLCFFRSPVFVRYVESVQMGIAYPAINDGQFFSGLIPLPPITEQHRIVAKVDELMALCDQLEQQQTHSIEAHQALVASLLGMLTRDESQQEFSAAWARIASHFDTLFTTEASIDQLKQTILQLAVMGKLVKQDTNDEPAEALYARIQRSKSELIKSGTIKRVSVEPNPTYDECDLPPSGWLWTRLGAVFDVRDGTHDTPKYTDEGFPLITSKNLYTGSLSFESAKLISEKDHRQISERSRVDRGDVLFAMIGSIGNPVIVDTDREFSIKNVALFKYHAASDAEPRFLLLYLNLVAGAMREKSAGGVQSFVSLGFLRNYPFPLPPINEQRRIVAKVDELMALCDAIKARLANAQTTQLHLADAIVEQAVA